MNKQDRIDLAHWVAKKVKAAGADDAAVNISYSRDIDIKHRDGMLEELKEATSNSLSINIYAANRFSGHSTNDIRKDSLGKFIEEAVAMTKYLAEDEFRKLTDPALYDGRADVDLMIQDPYHAMIKSEDRVAFAREVQEAASAQSETIASCTGYYSDSYSESVKVLSNGFEGSRQTTVFSAGADVSVDDGMGGKPEDWSWSVTRFYKDLPSPQSLADDAVKRVLQKVGQTKLESGLYDVIVENRAGSRLLAAFYGPMRASSLQQKRSFLEGKIGQQIASDKLTWTDDPFVPTALGSRLYDGDGIAAKKRVMIDKGVLKEYYIGNYYGRKLGQAPTTGGSSNVVIATGSRSAEEIVKATKKGILVTSFLGGNSNGTTGDFSFGIGGLYIEDGQIVKPCNEMNISGNMTEFWMQLAETGNDVYTYSSWRRPSMLFKDVQISGL